MALGDRRVVEESHASHWLVVHTDWERDGGRSRRRERVLRSVPGMMMEVVRQGGRERRSLRRGLNSLRRLEGTLTGRPSSVTTCVGGLSVMRDLTRSKSVF